MTTTNEKKNVENSDGDDDDNDYDASDDVQEDESKTICILSLSEKYLIERDEANSSVLCVNEFVQLSEIKLWWLPLDKEKEGLETRFKEKIFDFLLLFLKLKN